MVGILEVDINISNFASKITKQYIAPKNKEN